MALSLSQSQKTSQTQSQRMSQRQIQSLNLLSMNAEDLREEIFLQAEKNPALEIVSDKFQNGIQSARYKGRPDGSLRVGSPGSAGQEKSDAFQEILESRPDERRSLSAHLLEQLSLLDISGAEKRLCQKIIGNLDARGFYILAPASLLEAGEDAVLLEKCISIVQGMDPIGICVENVEKSLLLQARAKGGASDLALFFLDGRLSFLDPPQAKKILEKTRRFLAGQEALSFQDKDFSFLKKASEADVEEALSFIKGLDPFPARDYDQRQAQYVAPDIFVYEDSEGDGGSADAGEGPSFKIRISDSIVPQVRLASAFGNERGASPFAEAAVREAKVFLEGLEYRNNTIAKAAAAIVARQKKFFEKGPGNLVPLKLKDIADDIGVHESTVSRMASSKYAQCRWGLFPLKYFFSSAVADSSKESVLAEIQKIVAENSEKKLSDQKISDLLAQRGISVARRTVAKYRAQI